MKKLKQFKKTITNGIIEIHQSILRFSLSRKIKENLDTLSELERRQTYELDKLKREYELYSSKNSGLKEIEHHFFNGEAKLNNDNLSLALREEIKRLMGVITTQSEIIKTAI